MAGIQITEFDKYFIGDLYSNNKTKWFYYYAAKSSAHEYNMISAYDLIHDKEHLFLFRFYRTAEYMYHLYRFGIIISTKFGSEDYKEVGSEDYREAGLQYAINMEHPEFDSCLKTYKKYQLIIKINKHC